jgi:predicted PurR-regulated permease PerM
MITSNSFTNILFLVVGYFMYVTYSPFLIDIVIAILLSIAFFNIEKFFFIKIQNKYISSSLVTILLSFILFTPLFYFILGVADFIHSFNINSIQIVIEKIKELANYFPEIVSNKIKEFLTIGNIELIYNDIAKILGALTTKSAVFFKDMILIVIFFFFSTLYGKEILDFIKNISPLENQKALILFKDTQEVMGLVFYSTIVTAIFEGLLFGVFVQFYGFDGLFFAVMYAFASLIPIIGGAIMWIPISLYLYAKGDVNSAVEIILYSIIVISIIADTFVKPLIISYIKKELNNSIELSPLLIFFAIVAGLSSFGFWGVVLGPAITSLFISILKFYKRL